MILLLALERIHEAAPFEGYVSTIELWTCVCIRSQAVIADRGLELGSAVTQGWA